MTWPCDTGSEVSPVGNRSLHGFGPGVHTRHVHVAPRVANEMDRQEFQVPTGLRRRASVVSLASTYVLEISHRRSVRIKSTAPSPVQREASDKKYMRAETQ